MGDRKKSWREIDKGRDGSAHRKNKRGGGGGHTPRVESATRNYKRKLDALFDKGEMPEFMKEKMEAAGLDPNAGASNPRLLAVRAVRNAKSGKELKKALKALRDEFGLPEDDLEVLVRCLELDDDAVLLEALTHIEKHVEMGNALPNKKAAAERIRGLEFTSFDPRVQARAARLAGRL